MYFLDEIGGSLVAYDPETRTARELLPIELAGEEEEVEAEEEEAEPEIRKVKKPRKCSLCGKAGHSARTCSQKVAPSGVEGNEEWQKLDSASKVAPISSGTFGRIKLAQDNGIEAEVVARNLDIQVAVVEKAFEAEDYSEFSK